MDKEEKIWLGVLIVVAVLFNAITLSPLVPWQSWLLWTSPTPAQVIPVEMAGYQIKMPPNAQVRQNEFVQFSATSQDVTYGLGVFRQDGTLVFQMQVMPGAENKIVWKFDAPGTYDVRSTEYSGPRHSDMFVKNALRVVPAQEAAQ